MGPKERPGEQLLTEGELKILAERIIREKPAGNQSGIHELIPISVFFSKDARFFNVDSHKNYQFRNRIRQRLETFAVLYQKLLGLASVEYNFNQAYDTPYIPSGSYYVMSDFSSYLTPGKLIKQGVLLREINQQTKTHQLWLALQQRFPINRATDFHSDSTEWKGANKGEQGKVNPFNHQTIESNQQPVAPRTEPRPENVYSEEPVVDFQCPNCSKTTVVQQRERKVERYGEESWAHESYEHRTLVCLGCNWKRDLGNELIDSPLNEHLLSMKRKREWEREFIPYAQAPQDNSINEIKKLTDEISRLRGQVERAQTPSFPRPIEQPRPTREVIDTHQVLRRNPWGGVDRIVTIVYKDGSTETKNLGSP